MQGQEKASARVLCRGNVPYFIPAAVPEVALTERR